MCPRFSAPVYPHANVTRRIIGCFYEVYTELGAGFRESVYQRALQHALLAADLAVVREAPLIIWLRNRTYILDTKITI